jgi:hypothetical protein
MINGVAGGRHIVVNGGSNSGPYFNNNMPSSGMVRYNGNSQVLEAYDGINWVTITNSYPTINMSPAAEHAIDWAIRKMQEETDLEQLVKNNPAVKAAYENMKRAADQLKTTIILSKDE